MSLGTVNDLIDYFNFNRHIFQKQKNTHEHMERIMSMLSQQNMQILQKQFELYPNGLQLPTFIYLMKKLYTPQNEIGKYCFVSDLIKFFQAIDINGDGHMQWSQFTQYIIQNIRRIDKPSYKNKAFQQNQVISTAYSKISNQYKVTAVIETNANNPIKKIVYIPKQQQYYMLEAATNIIRIYDYKFSIIDYLQLKGENMHNYIIDFSFDKQNMIFGAIFEGSARFCNLKVLGNVKTCNQCEIKKLNNYHRVQFLSMHKYWAFLSKNGQLKLGSAYYKSRTNLQYSVLHLLKLHQTILTDIVEIQQPFYIATSSMDGNVKLYSCQLNKTLSLQHSSEQSNSAINGRFKKGILGIDYTRQFGSYMLSWGFSSFVLMYSLQISLTKGYVGKYKEHSGNLIAAKFLHSFPYVLSFDDRLCMRIWDFRRFVTIQVINCQKRFVNPSNLSIIPELSQCLICEKRITQFRAPSLEKKSRQINEFHVIFDFKICPTTNSIFLFTSNDVRVYNYNTGSLQKVFTKLSEQSYQTNITACQFGYKGRKFFLGDAAGFVRQYCSETGEFLQKIQPELQDEYENKAIIKIIFLKQHSLLIVCSMDGRIMIYERDSQSQFQIIRDLRETHFQLTCAEASPRYCTLATGGEDGTVNIWSIQKLTLQGVLVLQNKIVNIAFSPIHPIMIVSQQTGIMSLFYIRPHEQISLRNKCFAKIQYTDSSGIFRKIRTMCIQLVINAYLQGNNGPIKGKDGEHQLICVIGGEDGSIRITNISNILSEFNVEQNHQICTLKKSVKCEVHSMRTAIASQRKKILVQGYSNAGIETKLFSDYNENIEWQGHNQKVDNILYVKQNSIILSSSCSDKKLKVWTLKGQLNGAIDFFTFKKVSWKTAEMNFHKKLQAIDTTIYSMRLIQNKTLTSDQQQFIKIHLLINEYMNQQQKQEYYQWVSILKRTRRPVKRKQNKIKKQRDSEYDIRDQVQKYCNVNEQNKENKSTINQNDVYIDEETQEFNQIYSRLVGKIKQRIEKTQLPSINKRQSKQESRTKTCENSIAVQDFVTQLKKTLKNHAQDQNKIQKQYSQVMNKKIKLPKKSSNLLYQSLIQVRKNIQTLEKKAQIRSKKIRC